MARRSIFVPAYMVYTGLDCSRVCSRERLPRHLRQHNEELVALVLRPLFLTETDWMCRSLRPCGTVELFATSENLGVSGHSDASFGDAEDRKSTSGYVFKLCGGVICHKSQKQRLVTTSTTEAEYVALTHAAKEATWRRQLLTELGYGGSDLLPFNLFGDNKPSIKLAHSDGYSGRTKHVDIYYHYIKDEFRSGRIKLQHVRTADMIADVMTKHSSADLHKRFIAQLGLHDPRISR